MGVSASNVAPHTQPSAKSIDRAAHAEACANVMPYIAQVAETAVALLSGWRHCPPYFDLNRLWMGSTLPDQR